MDLILFLDNDPKMTARYLDDDNLNDQIRIVTRYLTYVAYTQNDLSSYEYDNQLFWIIESDSHYLFLVSYLDWLHKEYRFRFKENNRQYFLLDRIKDFCKRNYLVYDYVNFRYYGPEEYQMDNVFDSYLEFYKKELLLENPKHTNREFIN